MLDQCSGGSVCVKWEVLKTQAGRLREEWYEGGGEAFVAKHNTGQCVGAKGLNDQVRANRAGAELSAPPKGGQDMEGQEGQEEQGGMSASRTGSK